MKKLLRFLLLLSILTLFLSCSDILEKETPWSGNWYGYIGDSFYKLSFDSEDATLYYASDYGYRALYNSEKYEYTSKAFNVTFKKLSTGQILDKYMEIYGTMMSERTDGFFLWNSSDMPFFKLD